MACLTAGDAQGKTSLRLSPAQPAAGSGLTVTGKGWPARKVVTVSLAPAGGSPQRLGRKTTNARGAFTLRATLSAALAAGPYTLKACTARCARSRKTTFQLSASMGDMTQPEEQPTQPGQQQPASPTPEEQLRARMNGRQWFYHETNGDCSIVCRNSEERINTCSDGTFSDAYQSVDSLSGETSQGRDTGKWRVMSATVAGDGSITGTIGTIPDASSTAVKNGNAEAGKEYTVNIVVAPPGSSAKWTFGALLFTTAPSEVCS